MTIQQQNTNTIESSSSCCSQSSCCAPEKPMIRETAKVGRNDPCPCDSGQKFKKCCGR